MSNTTAIPMVAAVVRITHSRNGKVAVESYRLLDSVLFPRFDAPVAPGQSIRFPLTGKAIPMQDRLEGSFEAALFADGSSMGNTESLRLIQERRAALRNGFERLRGMIGVGQNAAGSAATLADQLRQAIESVPRTAFRNPLDHIVSETATLPLRGALEDLERLRPGDGDGEKRLLEALDRHAMEQVQRISLSIVQP
ncbi:MAG: hypothetical protein U0R19_01180 [Bryobacteraceae bacterium]